MDSNMMMISSPRRSFGKALASLAILAGLVLGMTGQVSPARAADEPEIETIKWPFTGVFGTYDTNALRRGYKVYKEVCSNCHSMNLLHFRNL